VNLLDSGQPWIPTGERSGLQTHRGDGKCFLVRAEDKLTMFLELESTIRAAERPEDCGGREIKFDKLSQTAQRRGP
jgi:hypothetical protein